MRNIKNGLFLFPYRGTIGAASTESLLKEMVESQSQINRFQIRGMVVSLHNCGQFAEEDDIKTLLIQLNKLQGSMKIEVALIDYSDALFHCIKPLAKPFKIKLFKNITAATLFMNPAVIKKNLRVLVYESDQQTGKMVTEALGRLGYTIIEAKTAQEYKRILRTDKIDITVTQTVLNEAVPKSAKKLSLSRELITNLPIIIDTAVETLVTLTELEAKKSDHSIRNARTDISETAMSAIMTFEGEINGDFLLVFPKPIALKAMTALLGDDVDEEDTEGIKDAIGEFCNIITGNTKTKLQDEGVFVLFELPRTYDTLKEAVEAIGPKEGIWINMLLDKEPFYIFITQ